MLKVQFTKREISDTEKDQQDSCLECGHQWTLSSAPHISVGDSFRPQSHTFPRVILRNEAGYKAYYTFQPHVGDTHFRALQNALA